MRHFGGLSPQSVPLQHSLSPILKTKNQTNFESMWQGKESLVHTIILKLEQ